MTWSDLIKELTYGFELHTNHDKKYGPVYHDGRRIGEVQLLADGTERVRLLRSNAATEGLFTVTRNQTWKGGYCEINKETIGACRRALELASAIRRPSAT
jgi:hypothetical protein